jgi:hypothetical protein
VERVSEVEATYRAVRPCDDDDFNVWVTTATAVRVFPLGEDWARRDEKCA